MNTEDQIAVDLHHKLRDDIRKAIEHFIMVASVAELSLSKQATVIMAVLDGLSVKLALEARMTREEYMEALNITFTYGEEAERRRKSR